jgi:hypothetical protein
MSGHGKNWWGPAVWTMIHVVAASYPDHYDKAVAKHFRAFIYALTRILPCGECRVHLRRNLDVIDPIDNYFQNNERLFLWTWKLHNRVNVMLGKAELPYNNAVQIYSPHNIDKRFWGRPIWKSIHSMAANYPQTYNREIADCFKAFMVTLTHLLPCDYCQKHLFEHLKTHQIDRYMNSRDNLFLWTWILHDEVSKHINQYVKGSTKERISLNRAREIYGLPPIRQVRNGRVR